MTWGAHRFLAVVAVAIGMSAGCAGSRQRPRARLGALPFPGPFTLYVSSDAGDLGAHDYANSLGEGARGIVYTCRAGFLDLAHLRESVDWTWFLYEVLRPMIKGRGGKLSFENDQTQFQIEVHPTFEIARLRAAERDAVLDEAALRLAQRAAYLVETWHEIESWYGLRTVFFVPEDRSAFTWDDSMSHAVGIQIGARVVKRGGPFDQTAAAEIKSTLADLQVVSKDWVDKAAHKEAGTWWRGSEPLRRDLDIGLTTGSKSPWLVQGLECCGPCEPAVMEVPSLTNVRGHNLSGMYQVRLTPNAALRQSMYKGEAVPDVVDAETEFPKLIEKMRAEMKARYGDDVDHP